jgi:hypothetical protein
MRVAVIAFFLMAGLTVTTEGATFNIVYDDSRNQQIGNIFGNATFSYDGPATVGSFSFQSLTGIAFTAHFQFVFPGGVFFSTADVLSLSSTNGITVFDAGNDQLGLVFTGSAPTFPFLGSLDARNLDPSFLSHEPTSSLDDRTGSFGNGTINAYSFRSGPFIAVDGDYRALSVPEPASLTILGLGLVIFLTFLCRTHPRASS